MKKLFLSLICLLSIVISLSAKVPANKFLIEGRLKNIPDSAVICIRDNDRVVMLDTVTNGRFQCSDTISQQKRLELVARSKGFPSVYLYVWVAPGKKVTITGNDNLICTWKVKSDIPEQKEYERYLNAKLPEYKDWLKLIIEENNLIMDLYVTHKGAEQYVKPTWTKVDSIRKLSDPLYRISDEKTLRYMQTAPVTPFWLEEYSQYVRSLQRETPAADESLIRSLAVRMSDDVLNTPEGKAIKEMLDMPKPLKKGDMMVDDVLFDVDGARHTLSEHKGKYILLDFWSQYCGPCIQSIPEAEEVAEEYKDKLAFVSICSDSEDEWKSFIANRNMKGLQWNQLKPSGTGLAGRYGVTAIPQYVIISPEGVIIDKWAGYGKGVIRNHIRNHVK